MATDVYRRGAKDVHRAIVSGGVRYDHAPCMLDGTGGVWAPVIPPGSRCPVCFRGAVAESRRRRRMATAAGGAGVLALVALVIAGQPDGDPVNVIGSPSWSPTFATFSSPTPAFTGVPSAAPTATSSSEPTPSTSASPVLTPEPSKVPPVPTRAPALPTKAPTPEPTECLHPGEHFGLDPCFSVPRGPK